MGFLNGSAVKNPPAIQKMRLRRSPEGENGNPFQYSCLENPIDKGSSGVGGRYSPKGGQESDTTEQPNTCTYICVVHLP